MNYRQPRSLNIIGCGRVGRTLGRLWQTGRIFHIQDVLTRGAATAEQAVAFIGAGHPVSQMAAVQPAAVWMLAVPDRQIAEVAAALARHAKQDPPAIAFHCSGALTSDLLAPLLDLGWQVASAHCVLSFAHPETALRQFAGTPCALEGDAAAALEPAFKGIGAQCFTLAAHDKLLYHAGAVFATNFVPVLQAIANQLWRDSGVPAPIAAHLQATLLRNAVDNIMTLGPARALTGPAARGDTALVARQGEAVCEWNPDAGAAYRALSDLAATLALQAASPATAP